MVKYALMGRNAASLFYDLHSATEIIVQFSFEVRLKYDSEISVLRLQRMFS